MREEIPIRLPRILTRNLTEVARPVPLRLSLRLTTAEPSTATLEIAHSEELSVTVGQFAELFETYGSLGIFQVVGVETEYYPGRWTAEKGVGMRGRVRLSLRHAICTLEDGMLFGYREYGGTGMALCDVLRALLLEQPTPFWQLGTVDYNTFFHYSFENESNLLGAIASTALPISDEYRWAYDFSTTPWTLHLLTSNDDACEMRLNRNIDTVTLEIDRSHLVNRIYPLGYGEGVNQLTIAEVNNGYKYLEDTASQAAWGLVALPFADTTITDASTLRGVAQAQLDARKTPAVTVTVTGSDLSALTGETADKLLPGRRCRCPLAEYGVTVDERIVQVVKADVYGKNTEAVLTLANRQADAVSEMANTAHKTRINELYSQGSTSFVPMHFADNADENNALDCDFYIDAGEVYINQVLCKFKTEAFRGYSRGAAAGGASTSGGGGAHTASSAANSKSVSGATTSARYVTSGAERTTTGVPSASSATSHTHEMHHKHDITDLSVTFPQGFFSFGLPSHTHAVPEHTHPPELGIYKGTRATSVSVRVDGTDVPASAVVGGQFDAVPYLAKDDRGRIMRNRWHSISFLPDCNSRIVCDIQKKTFVRAVTGGNY